MSIEHDCKNLFEIIFFVAFLNSFSNEEKDGWRTFKMIKKRMKDEEIITQLVHIN
jgi:uncharacterized membrane protein